MVEKKSLFLSLVQKFIPDITVNQESGFADKMFEVIQVDLRPDQVQIDPVAVLSPCQIPGDICLLHRSQVVEHLFDDLVEAYVFPQYIMNIGEQRMINICFEDLAVLFLPGNQQSCLLKTVQLQSYGIGGFGEFRLQIP